MKAGMSLKDLAAEIKRQAGVKVDYMADTSALKVVTEDGKGVALKVGTHGTFPIRPVAHRQIAEKTGITKPYYDRMLAEDPELLAYNINRWFVRQPEKRMVRTLDGMTRAFLSNRYRPLDYFDLGSAVFPILTKTEGLEFASCNITETCLYIKATTSKVTAKVRGELIYAGISIGTSEVGLGGLEVAPLIMIQSCLNGAELNTFAHRNIHLGRTIEADDKARVLYSDDTKLLDDTVFWSKIKDVVQATLDSVRFKEMVAIVEKTAFVPLLSAEGSVEVLADREGLPEEFRSGILDYLAKGGDLTQWGLSNAVTRFSQDVDDYDVASDLEVLGGKILTLKPTEWAAIGNAKAAAIKAKAREAKAAADTGVIPATVAAPAEAMTGKALAKALGAKPVSLPKPIKGSKPRRVAAA